MGKFTKEMVNDYADKLLIGLTEEEQENYYTVGVGLVELLAYRNMYKEDVERFNQRYQEIDKVIEELENK